MKYTLPLPPIKFSHYKYEQGPQKLELDLNKVDAQIAICRVGGRGGEEKHENQKLLKCNCQVNHDNSANVLWIYFEKGKGV